MTEKTDPRTADFDDYARELVRKINFKLEENGQKLRLRDRFENHRFESFGYLADAAVPILWKTKSFSAPGPLGWPRGEVLIELVDLTRISAPFEINVSLFKAWGRTPAKKYVHVVDDQLPSTDDLATTLVENISKVLGKPVTRAQPQRPNPAASSQTLSSTVSKGLRALPRLASRVSEALHKPRN